MKTKMRHWLRFSGLALALTIGSASAQDGSPPAGPEMPASSPATVSPASGATGRLVVYRIHAYPTLRTPKVMVNDRLMFRPKQKTYAEMDLPAGEHGIVVDWSMDTGWPDLAFVIEIKPGETKYLQISGSFTQENLYKYKAGAMAREVDPEKGAEDIRTCCRRLPLR